VQAYRSSQRNGRRFVRRRAAEFANGLLTEFPRTHRFRPPPADTPRRETPAQTALATTRHHTRTARSRFRSWCRKTCRFKSCRPHKCFELGKCASSRELSWIATRARLPISSAAPSKIGATSRGHAELVGEHNIAGADRVHFVGETGDGGRSDADRGLEFRSGASRQRSTVDGLPVALPRVDRRSGSGR
jgi:hypothetical protein